MKVSRELVAAIGAAVIGAFAIFGAVLQTPAANEDGPTTAGAIAGGAPQSARQAQMRHALDANPTIVPWLLEQSVTGDDRARSSAWHALYALAPIAASELIDGLANQDPAVRQSAMSFLPQAAETPGFPLTEAIAALLKIAENEREDGAFRNQAKQTVCQIICASQGVTISQPQLPAA